MKKKLTLWIVAIVIVVLVVAGLGVYLYKKKEGFGENAYSTVFSFPSVSIAGYPPAETPYRMIGNVSSDMKELNLRSADNSWNLVGSLDSQNGLLQYTNYATAVDMPITHYSVNGNTIVLVVNNDPQLTITIQ